MNILESRQKDIVILAIRGRFDATTAPVFDEKLLFMLEQGEKNFLLDFEHLEYVSSAGLRSFLVLSQKAKAVGGCVVCCSVGGLVKKVFEISKFCEILPTLDSVEDALKET